jgi:hypothetical protein
MSYYRGDYYRGDYYRRGDPFSIGGLFSGIGKVVSGAVGGMLTGGPIGAIAGGAAGLKSAIGTSIIPPAPSVSFPGGGGQLVQPMSMLSGGGQITPVPGLGGVISRILPGGQTGYYIKRKRRMNVVNPRALRRAIRRVSGFGKLVQRSKRAIARANSAVGNKSRATTRRKR